MSGSPWQALREAAARLLLELSDYTLGAVQESAGVTNRRVLEHWVQALRTALAAVEGEPDPEEEIKRLRAELHLHTGPTLEEAERDEWGGLCRQVWLEMAYENRCESAAAALSPPTPRPTDTVQRRFAGAVEASCSCGGKGPKDGCCQACEVWHRFMGRDVPTPRPKAEETSDDQ